VKTCLTGKQVYATRAAARQAMRAARARRLRYRARKTEQGVYRCEACGGWHLMSARQKA
jgi:hypothetical protein